MAKEDYLLNKCGNANPFRVPEGYFDNFAEKMMSELPDRTFEFDTPKKVSLWDKAKPVVYLAAMFGGIALMFAIAKDFSSSENTTGEAMVASTAVEQMIAGDDFSDAAADYCNYIMNRSGMDDYSMYLYMEEITE